jgi:ABC-type transport system involved in multi-copper enzyme maturation permease subunit
MTMSWRRVKGIVRKELAEYRRNRSVVSSMAVLPLVFMIQPTIAVVRLGSGVSGRLADEHVLVFMLAIPALVPVILAAYAVAGERQQGTLEPMLTTPIRREEFLLGKALAAFVPSLVVAYGVYVLYLALVVVLAQPGVASAVIQVPDLVAQLLFTPLLAIWSIWVGIGVSTRASDPRVAQQLGMLASVPSVIVIVLIAIDVIPVSLALAAGAAVLLLILDASGWRIVSRLFDRERLIIGSR